MTPEYLHSAMANPSVYDIIIIIIGGISVLAAAWAYVHKMWVGPYRKSRDEIRGEIKDLHHSDELIKQQVQSINDIIDKKINSGDEVTNLLKSLSEEVVKLSNTTKNLTNETRKK